MRLACLYKGGKAAKKQRRESRLTKVPNDQVKSQLRQRNPNGDKVREEALDTKTRRREDDGTREDEQGETLAQGIYM